jgi:hypothetical protein
MASSSRAARRKRNHGASRFARRPNVSLIWQLNTQIGETGSDLGSQRKERKLDGDITGPLLLARLQKSDGVLDQVKAKPLRGGPAGRP